MIENEETLRILEEIYKKAVAKVDSVASIHHYLIFGESITGGSQLG